MTRRWTNYLPETVADLPKEGSSTQWQSTPDFPASTEPPSQRLPFLVSNRPARDTARNLATHLLRPLPHSRLWVGAKPFEGLL